MISNPILFLHNQADIDYMSNFDESNSNKDKFVENINESSDGWEDIGYHRDKTYGIQNERCIHTKI